MACGKTCLLIELNISLQLPGFFAEPGAKRSKIEA
jgi:hypothetical protein